MEHIKIGNEKFEYEKIDLSYGTITFDEAKAKELLIRLKRIFDEKKLAFCLAYGTLLGVVREKDFIKGDEDIDIYVQDEEKLLTIIPELYTNDIKICRAYKHIYYSFIYHGACVIDVYILRPYRFSLWKKTCFNLSGYATPKKYLIKTQSIDFLNEKFDCPAEPEKILEFWYGKSWKIPKAGHNFRYEIYPAYCYRKVKYSIKSIIKFLIGYKYWKKKHKTMNEI